MKRFIYIFALLGIFFLAPMPWAHADEAQVLSKLDQLEKNQEQILKELDEIKSELRIVKVRASLKG